RPLGRSWVPFPPCSQLLVSDDFQAERIPVPLEAGRRRGFSATRWIDFETPFESASGLTRRPDPGYLRCGEERETTLTQSGGGPGPAKPQQPAREGAVLIPTRTMLESGPRKMRIARW